MRPIVTSNTRFDDGHHHGVLVGLQHGSAGLVDHRRVATRDVGLRIRAHCVHESQHDRGGGSGDRAVHLWTGGRQGVVGSVRGRAPEDAHESRRHEGEGPAADRRGHVAALVPT